MVAKTVLSSSTGQSIYDLETIKSDWNTVTFTTSGLGVSNNRIDVSDSRGRQNQIRTDGTYTYTRSDLPTSGTINVIAYNTTGVDVSIEVS